MSVPHAFEQARNDYQAARETRFRRKRLGLPAAGAGADYHYRSEADYLRVMEYARDMDRNDSVVGATIDQAVRNTIQDGFTLDPNTGDPGLDREWSARWDAWSNTAELCDLGGELSWWDLEQLTLRQCLLDGDLIQLFNESGALEPVEAHRCRTPKGTKRHVVNGVLLDATTRRRLEYWLTKEDVDPLAPVKLVSEIEPYPVRDEEGHRQLAHVYTSKRVSQTRGVTALAPVFDVCGMFEDINFAILVQRQIVSCFAIFRQMAASGPPAGAPMTLGAQTTEQQDDGIDRVLQEIAPGMIVRGNPGEKLEMHSPNIPNPEFFPHVKLILTLIGINLGLPLVMVLMDASETNFSGWRGAVDQARMGFRQNQRRLKNRLHTPVYHWQVRRWMAEDPASRTAARRSKVDPFRHEFNCPSWPYIEPAKDAAADLLRVRNGLTSQRRRCAERGLNWEKLSREIVLDNARMIRMSHRMAERLNQRYPGLNVTWREVASLPGPDGVNLQLALGDAQQNPNQGAGNASE